MRRLSGGVPYGTAPALAQLDGACGVEGGLLEIVVQTEPTIEVITWDGHSFSNPPGLPADVARVTVDRRLIPGGG